MLAPLIVVTGTGTNIGKTHIACALLRRAGRTHRVFGYKPIESGVRGGTPSDATRLAEASTFHVKHPPTLQLAAALSPHRAAELENRSLPWEQVTAFVRMLREQGVAVLLELPGGLFTPLTQDMLNIDTLDTLGPSATLLLAPDRLGVLHDVGATLAGAAHKAVRITAVGLVYPAQPDASTDGNASDLKRFIGVPVIGTWAWSTNLDDDGATTNAVALWLKTP